MRCNDLARVALAQAPEPKRWVGKGLRPTDGGYRRGAAAVAPRVGELQATTSVHSPPRTAIPARCASEESLLPPRSRIGLVCGPRDLQRFHAVLAQRHEVLQE